MFVNQIFRSEILWHKKLFDQKISYFILFIIFYCIFWYTKQFYFNLNKRLKLQIRKFASHEKSNLKICFTKTFEYKWRFRSDIPSALEATSSPSYNNEDPSTYLKKRNKGVLQHLQFKDAYKEYIELSILIGLIAPAEVQRQRSSASKISILKRTSANNFKRRNSDKWFKSSFDRNMRTKYSWFQKGEDNLIISDTFINFHIIKISLNFYIAYL